MILANANTKALPMPQVEDLQSNSGTHHKQVQSGQNKHKSMATPKSKSQVHNTDYSEKTNGKEQSANDSEKFGEKKKSKEKNDKKSSPKKTSGGQTANVDDNAVPDPAPDSGSSKASAATVYHSGALYSGVLPVVPPTPTSTHPITTSGFSPLPLAAFATSLSAVTVSGSSSAASLSSSLPTAIQKAQHADQPQASKRLPTVSIALLAAGGILLIIGLIIFGRVCSRPRKHKYPTPSRPVLQDPFQDDEKVDADEESLFGGKERSSTRPASGEVLLNWTKYPHTSLVKPLPTLDFNGSQHGSPTKRAPPEVTRKAASPFLNVPPTPGSNFGSRSPNRLSAVSASVYPGSPVSTMGGHVGIAVGGSPLTADNLPPLQRSNTKTSLRRVSQAGRVNRHSVIPSTYGTSDLYGGMTSPIPVTPKPTAASTAAGRARVKAPYAPGAFLRASATAPVATASALEDSNPFEESQYILPPISPMMKTEDRRERDTRALASALGFSSPGPSLPSPQMTLYPDDSITLAGDRRRSRTRSQILSPPLDANARLGKLMMGDFQSMASLPSTRNVGDGPSGGPSRGQTKNIPRKRVEEKPPRVPSPPPMPSLAQMAMSHGNPHAFEDYRSPTYSIYGLYEAERKSRLPGEGGY